MLSRKIFILFTVFTSLVGCSRQSQISSFSTSGTGKCLMDSLSSSDVFLTVGDRSFTKHDFVVASSLYDKLNRMRARDPLVGFNTNAEAAVRARCPFVVSSIERRALIHRLTDKVGVKPSESNFLAAARNFQEYVRYPNKDLAKIAEEIGGKEGKLLLDYWMEDAKEEALRECIDTNNTLCITTADVLAISNKWQTFNKTASISNAFEKALLEKAREEIRAGADFKVVAKKYSITPDEAEEWDEGSLDDFEDSPALSKWLVSAKPGDISDVLETEDGWDIVKVIDQDKDDDDDQDGEESWELVRIHRHFWESIEPATHDEIVDALTSARRKELQKRIGDMAVADVVVRWPHGTNLFDVVSMSSSKISVDMHVNKRRALSPMAPNPPIRLDNLSNKKEMQK